ncbi:MAG: dihydrolipoamide acetyltransferase family protein [Anaerolineales bacterium]
MPTNVIMPQLGESVVEGTVSKWLKREGDSIQELEPLLEVNTDKVDTEVPAPASGVLLKLLVPEGTTVKVGTTIALIGQPGESAAAAGDAAPASGNGHHHAASAPSSRPPSLVTPSPTTPSGRQRDLGFISPVVAKLADEHKVDLYQIKGTGQGGRITKKDVLAFIETQPSAPVKTEAPAWEQVGDGDLFRPTELQFGTQGTSGKGQGAAVPPSPVTRPPPSDSEFIPVEGMRKLIAEHMVRSKQVSPHVTTVFEADLSRVLAHLEKNQAAFERDSVKLTLTAYFITAMVAAVKAVPLVNSQWTDEKILLKREVNIGMAVALDEGLIVPVLKRADEKSLLGLAREINDLAKRARAKALKADEVQGGTLTLTNHGVSGSLFATPIINQPQTAIVGVGKMEKRVVVINDAIAIRPMAYLTLTFDHRVLDGAVADRFMATMKKALEEWG